MKTCDAMCNDLTTEGCRGSIKRVEVRGGTSNSLLLLTGKMEFDYCDRAIAKDREMGFEVKVIEEATDET